MLHAQNFVYWRGAALVQYWRSFEQLERFARDPSLNHLEPWKRFNRAVGADGSVGIWHERTWYRPINMNVSTATCQRWGWHWPVRTSRRSVQKKQPGCAWE